MYEDIYMWAKPPASALLLADQSGTLAPSAHQHTTTIYLDGNYLRIRVATCANCRRLMGWSFVGELRLMTEQQVRQLQQHLGPPVSAQAPMTSLDQWRTHFGK